MRSLKWTVLGLWAAMIIVFMIQNAALVEFKFLNADFEMRRSVVVVICILFGFIIGWVVGTSRQRRS